jgi:arsenate reductase-like glutaredoxin family protein
MSETRILLDEAEKASLQDFQKKVHQVIIDLGKIELQLSDLLNVKEQVKDGMSQIVSEQNQFFATLEQKYGKGLVDPHTFEYVQQ